MRYTTTEHQRQQCQRQKPYTVETCVYATRYLHATLWHFMSVRNIFYLAFHYGSYFSSNLFTPFDDDAMLLYVQR